MRSSFSLLLLICGACGGQAIDVGFDDAQVSHFDPSAPVDMSAVRARCAAPGTTDEPYTTDDASRALLAGRWFLCESGDDAGMTLPQAFEFTADGVWFALTPNDAGVWSRGRAGDGRYGTGKVTDCCYPDTWMIYFGAQMWLPPTCYVVFRHGPLQMRWAKSTSGEGRPTIARFVKG
jgi:hypothetical protein